MVHFERGTKQRYRLGPIDQGRVEEGLRRFRTAAAILEAELSEGGWLVGDSVSYADFRMAAFLPFNDVAGLPLEDYPSVDRWYRQLEAIDAWRDPFEGLDAPQIAAGPGTRHLRMNRDPNILRMAAKTSEQRAHPQPLPTSSPPEPRL